MPKCRSEDHRFMMIYISILGIQFHPANGVMGDSYGTAATVVKSYDAAVLAYEHLLQQDGVSCSPV